MRKKRNYVDGGQLASLAGGADPYMALAMYGTQMAGDYMSAFNYKPQLGPEKSQKDYNKEIILKGLQGGVVGAIPAIIRMNKDKNTIVSGSPGTYQQGGPIKIGKDETAAREYRPANLAIDGVSRQNQILGTIPASPIMLNQSFSGPLNVHSSKSKSRDRFREHATGGPITPNYQTLGNIKFDSNKTKWKNGVLVAKDEISGKDYGVVRENSGSYRFYNEKTDRPLDDVEKIRSFYKGWIDSSIYDNINNQGKGREDDYKKAKMGEKTQVGTTPVRLNVAKDRDGSHYNRKENIVYIDPADSKEFGQKTVVAHELNHAREEGPWKEGVAYMDLGYGKNYNYKTGSVDEYMQPIKKIIQRTGGVHDVLPEEYRSDINAARYLMFDKSIYDPINQPFTREHLDKLKADKILKNNELIQRLLKNSKDEDSLIKAFNSISEVSKNSYAQNVATGGPITPNYQTLGDNKPIKTPFNRASGGAMDQQLSDTSFQVKDNPNVTDGKYYSRFNANLDHNEVVDSEAKFVFSDDLNDPNTGKSFAQAVKPLYSRKGKLENRKDPISQATIGQLNKQIEDLAMTQEQLATMLGLRNDEQNRANGGIITNYRMRQSPPLVEAPTYYASGGKLPWEGFDVAEFQQWYNSMPGGTPLTVDGKWGPTTQKAYESAAQDYMKIKGKNIVDSVGGMSTIMPDGSTYVDVNPVNGKVLPSSIGQVQKLPQIYDTTNLPSKSGYSLEKNPNLYNMAEDMFAYNVVPSNGSNPNLVPQASQIAEGMKALGNSSLTKPVNTSGTYGQGMTLGDIFQGIEVGSKFFNTLEGPEQEGQLLDSTPITKTAYDVNPALYQNQRSYRNAVNSIGTASSAQRKALSNQLLATKLNADNQVLSNYQNMNNEALVNYENRLSQRRQQNIASTFRTNDLNAANRGMYDQAQQNAFTSLGNLGEAMNRRKQSYDALDLLRINYPDIYESTMKDLETIKKRRSTELQITH